MLPFMFEDLRDPELVKKFDYKTAPIKRLVPLSNYGLTEGDYGGRATMFAELKEPDNQYLLLVNNALGETIAVGKRKKKA